MKTRSKRSTQQSHHFQPQLEVLENRWCPSLTLSVNDGHTLQVGGDRGDNIILVELQGPQTKVTGNGSPMQTFTGIDTIRVNTWAGRDTVCVVVTAPPPDPDFSFSADLGAGDDTFTLAVLPAAPDIPARDSIFQPTLHGMVQGGAGNDTFQTTIGKLDLPPSSARPHLFTALDLDFAGGSGNDRFLTDVTNITLSAALSLTMTGDQGDDTFRTTFRSVDIDVSLTLFSDGGQGHDVLAFSHLDGTIEGAVHLAMLGGNGNDMLTADLLPAVQRGGAFIATIDGGDGQDVIHGVEDPNEMPGGLMDVAFRGGKGDDDIGVTVNLFGFTPESGQVRVAVDGGEDSDHLMFLVRGALGPEENVLLTLDGGPGGDFALVSALVQVRNCEHIVTV